LTRTEGKLRWGVLSTAAIGWKKVIPAMQLGALTRVDAIASRDLAKAQEMAAKLGIGRAYGSYEELLADSEIDAIYNPLPNHLHVPWTIKAAEAGKHVLCEKPLALTAAEARTLIAVRERTGVRIGEAFMVDCHPQWIRLRELLRAGAIGEVRAMSGFFTYFNVDPHNIRNQAEIGGGALMDIGCYMVHAARFGFEAEPLRVAGSVDRDPVMKTDRVTSAVMEFSGGRQATFLCSTQLAPFQRLSFFGTRGRIELEIPVNSPTDRETRLVVDTGADLFGGGATVETFAACDQYTLQGDAFSRAVLEGGEVPVSVEDGVANMAAIEAVFRSGESGRWETPLPLV
jgi:predicted dehydrogenase